MEENLSLYRIFNSVAATGNISRSAKELYISQPAISKGILRLEENIGVTLFIRSSRGVKLTEEGKLLYEYTKSAFDTLKQGELNIKNNLLLGIGHIRIGVSTTLCKYLLLPYLKPFVEKYPHIKITIECQSTFETLELLEQNKIDVGLIGRPLNLKNLDFYKIMDIEDIFVTSTKYLNNLELRECSVKSNTPLMTAEIFRTANIMLLDEKNMTRIFIEDYFTKNLITTNQILQVNNMDLLIEFAKIGLGISCVIKEFVEKELESGILFQLPLENPLDKRDVGFAYMRSLKSNEALEKFIHFYKELYQI
ncbi:MAG: LysR family transcriptional regulator [Anaerocolumna sp.]